jgi:hypothetical protein
MKGFENLSVPMPRAIPSTFEDSLMFTIDEDTVTGAVRAEVSFSRDNGQDVPRPVSIALAIADLLELPDDTMFIPATTAAMGTPSQMNDPASLARTRDVAIAAGYGKSPSMLPGLA